MKFTKREKRALLIAVAVVLPALLFLDQQAIDKWEIAWNIFVVLPLAIYIITDPERLNRS